MHVERSCFTIADGGERDGAHVEAVEPRPFRSAERLVAERADAKQNDRNAKGDPDADRQSNAGHMCHGWPASLLVAASHSDSKCSFRRGFVNRPSRSTHWRTIAISRVNRATASADRIGLPTKTGDVCANTGP